MEKYLIYGEGNKKPIRKTKHENDAFMFMMDIKNLQQHGCMTLVREDDNGDRQVWNEDIKAWESTEGQENE